MKLQNAIKKVAALSTGAAMLGASVLGAVAYDLSNYPEPFIKNGQFNGVLVVGSSAKPSDILGVTDIAMSLQASAVVQETVNLPGQTTQTVVEGGAKVAAGGNGLLLGDAMNSLKPSFTGDDLDLLKPTTVEDVDGTQYDVEYQVDTPGASITFGRGINDLTEPKFYVDFTGGQSWDFVVRFPEGVDVDKLKGQTIKILGEDYTFGEGSEVNQSSTPEIVTLYRAGVDKTFSQDDGEVTVQVGNKEVKVEVVGGLSNDRTAVIKVNGESKTVEEGRSYTIGGERVYVKDVMLLDIPTPHAAVRLFLGAEKIELKDGNAVKVKVGSNEDTIQGTSVSFTASGGKTSEIKITYTPNQHDPAVDGVLMGDSYVDPVFHGLKWDFTSMSPAVDSDMREKVHLYPDGEDRLKLKFTSYAGDDYDLVLFRAADSTTQMRYASGAEKRYVVDKNWDLNNADNDTNPTTGTYEAYDLVKYNRFVVRPTVNTGNAGAYTRVLEITNIDSASSPAVVTVKDVATGTTRDVTLSQTAAESATGDLNGDGDTLDSFPAGTFLYDGYTYGFVLLPAASTPLTSDSVLVTDATFNPTPTYGPVASYLVTKQGAEIDLPVGSYDLATAGSEPTVDLVEDTPWSEATPAGGVAGTWNFKVTYTSGQTGKDLRVATITAPAGTASDSADNSQVTEYISKYGTYVKHDTSDTAYDAEVYYYGKDTTQYDVFLAPASAGTTTSGGEGSVTTEKVQKINVGAAKLDTEVQDLVGKENMIVVGGPCVNSVAAELMGNPAECAAGFEEGKAIIKAFDGENGAVSILVAGYSGQDTRLASQVLAQYDDPAIRSKLTGSEVVVQGTSISNVVISAPAQESNTNSTQQ